MEFIRVDRIKVAWVVSWLRSMTLVKPFRLPWQAYTAGLYNDLESIVTDDLGRGGSGDRILIFE
jgi:hypothetical protein